MTKHEKILRQYIRESIKKTLSEKKKKETHTKSLKQRLGKSSSKVTGGMRTKFKQLDKILSGGVADKIKRMSRTQKIDFLTYLVSDIAKVSKKDFNQVKQRISGKL